MYSEEVIKLAEASNDKSSLIRLSLNKIDSPKIKAATAWMDLFYKALPLKIRCITILAGYDVDTFPKCPTCGSPVGYDKEYQSSFNMFCSDKCSKEHGRLSDDVKSKLYNYDWMYNKRIVERVSYSDIGKMFGISEVPVMKASNSIGIPKVKLNESVASVKRFLDDKEFLYEEHVTNHRKMRDIAEELGTSASSISLAINAHNIPVNPINSYDRADGKVSLECMEVYDYICTMIPSDLVQLNNRSVLSGLELDIYIPSMNIGFEYNGVFFHVHKFVKNEVYKDKNYHLNKTEVSKSKGVKLIHIFSDDWKFNKDVVKGLIAAKLNIFSDTIFARKCDIDVIENFDKIPFLNMNHMQGKDKSSIQYGLRYNGELVAVMTFCKSRYNKNVDWELSRFAVKRYTKVIGGFSKLLARFKKDYQGSIVSYADRTHSEGDVYIKNGFVLDRINKPSYAYVNCSISEQRMHRANFMKEKIGKDDDRAEWEIMFDVGYKQIYDCGTITYIMK